MVSGDFLQVAFPTHVTHSFHVANYIPFRSDQQDKATAGTRLEEPIMESVNLEASVPIVVISSSRAGIQNEGVLQAFFPIVLSASPSSV